MRATLTLLLSPAPLPSLPSHTLDRALAAGLAAPSVGAAFLAGYRAALSALVPALGDTPAALCASEDGGAHPRAIETALTRSEHALTLDGTKRFVTGASTARVLLVLAHEGTAPDGTRRLALVRVPADHPSLAWSPMPALPFVPDVDHASVTLSALSVPLESRLPGDGWTDYVRPFRTVEDVHVCAAVTAFALRHARAHDDLRPLAEQLVALALTLRALADGDPSAPSTHLALAGCFTTLDALAPQLDALFARSPELPWARDRRILTVARSAREQRRAKAWASLHASDG